MAASPRLQSKGASTPKRSWQGSPWLHHRPTVVIAYETWACQVTLQSGERVDELIHRLRRSLGIENCAALATGRAVQSVLSGVQPVPAEGFGGGPATLWIRPRGSSQHQHQAAFTVLLYGGTAIEGGTPLLIPALACPADLRPVVMAISGTGAAPDFWYNRFEDGRVLRPTRLRKHTPVCLQVYPLGGAVITWTFTVERRWETRRLGVKWRPLELLHRALQWERRGEDNYMDQGPAFWAAQRDLCPGHFSPRERSRSPQRSPS
jgi:hypothetical protein